jgi:hypothetical protein
MIRDDKVFALVGEYGAVKSAFVGQVPKQARTARESLVIRLDVRRHMILQCWEELCFASDPLDEWGGYDIRMRLRM